MKCKYLIKQNVKLKHNLCIQMDCYTDLSHYTRCDIVDWRRKKGRKENEKKKINFLLCHSCYTIKICDQFETAIVSFSCQ